MHQHHGWRLTAGERPSGGQAASQASGRVVFGSKRAWAAGGWRGVFRCRGARRPSIPDRDIPRCPWIPAIHVDWFRSALVILSVEAVRWDPARAGTFAGTKRPSHPRSIACTRPPESSRGALSTPPATSLEAELDLAARADPMRGQFALRRKSRIGSSEWPSCRSGIASSTTRAIRKPERRFRPSPFASRGITSKARAP